MNFPAVALLMLVNLLWSLNVVVSKIAVDDLGIPPIFYAFARSVLVVLALLPLLRPIPRHLWRVLAVGLAISGGSFALLYVGLRTASPATAGVVGLSGAPLGVIFAIIFLGERVRWRRALGIALAFGGVLIAVASPDAWQASGGVALIFGSALVGALGTIFVKRIDLSSVRLQAWAGVASVVVLLPLTLATESRQIESLAAAPFEAAACLLFAGLIVSVGAHSAYYWILKRHDTNQVIPLTLLSPLFTVVLGAWLTNDRVGMQLVVGGLVALAGVTIIVLRPSTTFSKNWIVRGRL